MRCKHLKYLQYTHRNISNIINSTFKILTKNKNITYKKTCLQNGMVWLVCVLYLYYYIYSIYYGSQPQVLWDLVSLIWSTLYYPGSDVIIIYILHSLLYIYL